MLNRSNTWKSLMSSTTQVVQRRERFLIGPQQVEHTFDDISAGSIDESLVFGGLEIGGAVSKVLNLDIKPKVDLPRLTQIIRQVQLFSGSTSSEWLTMGYFFVDTVEELDTSFGFTHVVAYDVIAFADKYPQDVGIIAVDAESIQASTFLTKVSEVFGIQIDSIAGEDYDLLLDGYTVRLHTIRETLGHIAVAAGGNWCTTGDSRIHLQLYSTGSSVYDAGDSVSSLKFKCSNLAVTRVEIGTDSTSVVAGESEDFVVRAECPYAVDATAQNVLNRLSTYRYTGFNALSVRLDPAIELGDYITINGNVVQVLQMHHSLSTSLLADVRAPFDTPTPQVGELSEGIRRVRADVGEFKRLTIQDENGETKINGGSIMTGTIEAESIKAGTLYGVGIEGSDIDIFAHHVDEDPEANWSTRIYTIPDNPVLGSKGLAVDTRRNRVGSFAAFSASGLTLTKTGGGAQAGSNIVVDGSIYAGSGIFTQNITLREPWTNLTLASGVTAGSFGGSPTGQPAYRVVGGMCYLVGSVNLTAVSSGSVVISTLTASARPSSNVYIISPCGSTRVARLFVSTDGRLVLEWLVNISDGSRYAGSTWVQINMTYPV